MSDHSCEFVERGSGSPVGGLDSKRHLYRSTVDALGDPASTTVVLVSRADRSALREAARAGEELAELGIGNQHLVLNGLFSVPLAGDEIAEAFAGRQAEALAAMPASLDRLPASAIPLVASDLCGVESLRALVRAGTVAPPLASGTAGTGVDIEHLDRLVADLAADGRGVVMVMGKGGVGKTTVAVSLAAGCQRRRSRPVRVSMPS